MQLVVQNQACSTGGALMFGPAVDWSWLDSNTNFTLWWCFQFFSAEILHTAPLKSSDNRSGLPEPSHHRISDCGHVSYIWWGLALPQPAVGLPVSLLVSMATGVSLDEGDVVVVGAGGSSQDPHEVTVVAEVLQQSGHPPEHIHTHTVQCAVLFRDL